jgi:hypothetical protein
VGLIVDSIAVIVLVAKVEVIVLVIELEGVMKNGADFLLVRFVKFELELPLDGEPPLLLLLLLLLFEDCCGGGERGAARGGGVCERRIGLKD